MEDITDPVFGELSFEDDVWMRDDVVVFLGEEFSIELTVEGNDGEILATQRDAFMKLPGFLPKVEDAVFTYYQQVCSEYRSAYVDEADADREVPIISQKSELSSLINMVSIIFQMMIREEETSVGFIFRCSWEPEHGLGVLITNGDVVEVGFSDLVT